MESLQCSPGFPEEKTKQSSLSFSDGFFSRKKKPKGRREDVPESDFENLFNFSFIFASSLILAGGVMLDLVVIWVFFWSVKIPRVLRPNIIVVTMPFFALLISILSLVLSWHSLIKYRQRRNRKSRILLAILLGFVANILMLIGAFQCHQFQTHLSVEETEADGRSVLNLMRTYLFDQMALLISNALPGTEEMEQWNNMQSTFSCCGLNDYLDWIPFETVPPIPSSCCISYKKAEKLASHYQKTGDIVCFEKQVSKCIYGKCKIPALYGELYKGPNCSLGAVSPIGCLEVVELTILRMIEICEKMFLICVVAYVIAEIIMGITLLIYSRPVQVKSVFFNGTLKIINGSRS